MIVTTGFGYYTDANGHIVSKYVLPVGTHPDPVGVTVTEVADQTALEAIQIYVAPVSPVQAFSVDVFVQALFAAFAADSNLFPYYAVLKDLATYKNFFGMKNIVSGLLAANVLTQAEVDTLNGILAQQNIVLSTFTS